MSQKVCSSLFQGIRFPIGNRLSFCEARFQPGKPLESPTFSLSGVSRALIGRAGGARAVRAAFSLYVEGASAPAWGPHCPLPPAVLRVIRSSVDRKLRRRRSALLGATAPVATRPHLWAKGGHITSMKRHRLECHETVTYPT